MATMPLTSAFAAATAPERAFVAACEQHQDWQERMPREGGTVLA